MTSNVMWNQPMQSLHDAYVTRTDVAHIKKSNKVNNRNIYIYIYLCLYGKNRLDTRLF